MVSPAAMPHTHSSSITVEPLSPSIGAEVKGINLARLDDREWEDIARAFALHQVLFFRDQQLTPEQHKALGPAWVLSTSILLPPHWTGTPRS